MGIGIKKWIYWGDDVRMEEPLIIRRDEYMFESGMKICLVGLIVVVLCSIAALYRHINPLADEIYSIKSVDDIISCGWLVGLCIVVFVGVPEMVRSYGFRYKLDENGITEKYNNSALRTLRTWAECDSLGVKMVGEYRKGQYRKIVCSRNIGGSVLEICYTPEMWKKISTYVGRHGVQILEPGINVSRKRKKYRKKDIKAGERKKCVLRDIEGEFLINDKGSFQRERKNFAKTTGILMGLLVFVWYLILSFIDGSFIKYIWAFPAAAAFNGLVLYNEEAEAGNKWTVSRKGIESTSPFRKKTIFYEWNEIERTGVYSEGGQLGYYMFFKIYERRKKIKVRFTEKRYEEFLKYVPEGKETDPITSEFLIRWRSAMRSYGKSRDDFDEW